MHSDVCDPMWFKLGMMIDTTELYIMTQVYITLTLIHGDRHARKVELLCQLSPKVINGFRWHLASCWDLLVRLSDTHFLCDYYSRENPTSVISSKNLRSGIYRLILVKLSLLIDITELLHFFSWQILALILIEFGMLPWLVGLFKIIVIFFFFVHPINMQEREINFGDFEENMSRFGRL